MEKRHMEEDSGNGNSERWLLTYSDLITLLLALFIIMYGMSTENQAKVQEVSSALSQAFNRAEAGQAGVEGGAGAATAEGSLQNIYNELEQYIKQQHLEESMELVKADHSISIHLKDSILFQGNSAILVPESKATLAKVTTVIAEVYDEVNHITITGNTADLGHRDKENEADSWQLSVDRAVQVLTVLTSQGLSPEKLSIEGNSHYNPVASNDTAEGRSANRRVEITITDGAN